MPYKKVRHFLSATHKGFQNDATVKKNVPLLKEGTGQRMNNGF